MSNAYDRCIVHALEHQNAIEGELKNTTLDDLVTHYESVAKAFPSSTPNEHSLEIPLVDEAALVAWAKERGWSVKLAPEMASNIEQVMPPVRFIRER